MNNLRATDILIEKIKKDYQDDIALVVIMGSTIYGETHSRSDLDLYYIPNTKRGYNLGFTFIIDDIGFDFWPISWDRIQRIADYEERITSIVTEGKILYYSNEDDLERFNQIKQKALDTTDTKKFIQRAHHKLHEVYKDFVCLMNAMTISDIRKHGIFITNTIATAIALLNKTTIKRGRGKLKQEVLNMSIIPKDFSRLYDTVFISNDIKEIKKSLEELIKNTEMIIMNEKLKQNQTNAFNDIFDGFYEELINFYNKIYHASEVQDSVTALFASVELTREIEVALFEAGITSAELPDLISAYDPNNLKELVLAAQQHQKECVELLRTNKVEIREFADFNELENYINQL